MTKDCNVLVAGVGGQGLILMSEMLGKAAVRDGLRVKGSEIIGSSQRGGAVNSVIRIGGDPQGPVIPQGRGNLIIGLEPLEALKHVSFMGRPDFVLVSTQQVIPFTVVFGNAKYPSLEVIIEKIKHNADRVITIDAVKLASEAGSERSANIVMLGAALGTGLLPIKIETVKSMIEKQFKGQVAQFNLKAFDLGYEVSEQTIN